MCGGGRYIVGMQSVCGVDRDADDVWWGCPY